MTALLDNMVLLSPRGGESGTRQQPSDDRGLKFYNLFLSLLKKAFAKNQATILFSLATLDSFPATLGKPRYIDTPLSRGAEERRRRTEKTANKKIVSEKIENDFYFFNF